MSILDWIFDSEGFLPKSALGPWTSVAFFYQVSHYGLWLIFHTLSISIGMVMWRVHNREIKVDGTISYRLFWTFVSVAVLIVCCAWSHFFESRAFFDPIYRFITLIHVLTFLAAIGAQFNILQLYWSLKHE